MSDWWTHGYPGGPMVKAPPLPRPLYPPDAPGRYVPSSNGPDIEAIKRTVSRAGRWPWQRFDQAYSNAFSHGKEGGMVADSGVAGVQRQLGLDDTGFVGVPTYNGLRSIRIPDPLPHAGEPAMDATAVNLLYQAAELFASTPDTDDEGTVQRTIVDYCRRALANIADWHYRQARPMQSLGLNPDGTIYSDCSEGVTAAYYWARQQTGLDVPDPNGNDFDGYGYTETLWQHNPTTPAPYRVGDLALYSANGGHVTICIAAGDSSSSAWWSNGSEGGPYQETLHYRTDLRGVVRPDLVA